MLERQRQPRRGRFPFRRTWYSICSMHYYHDESCDLCKTGDWSNDVRHWLGGRVFRYCPRLWRWWVNRPSSSARKRLKEWFPNLK